MRLRKGQMYKITYMRGPNSKKPVTSLGVYRGFNLSDPGKDGKRIGKCTFEVRWQSFRIIPKENICLVERPAHAKKSRVLAK